MKNFFRGITVGLASLLLVLSFPHDSFARMFKFSGGPSGGTFQYYASAISTLAKKNKVNVLASSSGGSIENIRLTDSGRANFSVAYSGHVFQARNGKMKGDPKKYENVLAVAYFYGAPAQLVGRLAPAHALVQALGGQ